MLNIIENKVEHCRKYGIIIEQEKWDVKFLPTVMLSDKDREYVSDNFSQSSSINWMTPIEKRVSLINTKHYNKSLFPTFQKSIFNSIVSHY